MTSENKIWESLKNEYLHKVQKALSSVKHPRSKEVLEDVRSHLDRRFDELGPGRQTQENFQTIISEMGPASDYAELLEPQSTSSKQKLKQKYLTGIVLVIVVIIAAAIVVLKSKSPALKVPNLEQGRIEDKIDYPFVNDPAVIGAWKSVDYVKTKKEFTPNQKSWKDKLYLNHLIFEEDGIVAGNIYIWTKGLVINEDGKTASAYDIKKIGDDDYMFFEWKSGDYTIRHRPPRYYVLKKVSLDDVKPEAMFGQTADLPPTSIIDEKGHIVDKTDYPFVNDPEALGAWESVDFVRNIEDFDPEKENAGDDLFLKELFILEGGKTNLVFKWTNGLILSDDTASKYLIKKISGSKYMFFEWKSGDYTIRHTKPSYYVLKHIPGKVFVESRTVDKIDYPFVDDPSVIGTWRSVDFVKTPEEFSPDRKRWKAEDLFLKELVFLPDGKTEGPWSWTKGLILHSGDKTAARYLVKEIAGSKYMFFEWKSGDYTLRRRQPSYYVLKKD